MQRTVTALALALALAGSEPARSHPHPPLVVKINPENRAELLKLDLEKGTTTVLYRSARERIVEARVSPFYSRVALLETTSTASAAAPVNRLVVIDARGKLLREVDADVRRFVFSPNGRRLACIAGPFYPGGVGFRPQRAFIVDIDGTSEPRELPGLERAHDLHWSTTPAENAIYFRAMSDGRDRVLRWDVRSGRLEASALEGILLSPDGKYLLRRPHEVAEVGDCDPGAEADTCLRVTERESGEAVRGLAGQSGTPQGWVYNRGHHLLFIQRSPRTETVTEERAGRQLQAELVTGYAPAEGLVFEVGSGKPPESVVGIVGGDASAGDWVTGDRGLIVTSTEPDSRSTLAVCEQLPCEERSRESPQPEVARLPAPASDQLEPAGDVEFPYANPRFRWAPVPGAAWYRLDVCGDRECGTRVAGDEKIMETVWRSGALPVGELYWRVAAVETDGSGGAPIVGQFTAPARFFVRSARLDLDPPVTLIEVSSAPGERVIKEGRALGAPSISLTPQVDDDLSGIEWWRAEVDGRAVTESREAGATVLEGPWGDGVHEVVVTAEDQAGNRSAAASEQFAVDGQPPTLILQFVTPELVAGSRQTLVGGSRISEHDFQWFELTEESELGITSVFFDRPRKARAPRPRRPDRDRAPLAFTSSWPELVMMIRGEWPFSSELEEAAEGRRLLWLAAADRRSGVASLELRAVTEGTTSGQARFVEITATDLVGNVSPPLRLELIP